MAFIYVVQTKDGSLLGTFGARKRAREEAYAHVVEDAAKPEDIEIVHDNAEGYSGYSDRGSSEGRTADIYRMELL